MKSIAKTVLVQLTADDVAEAFCGMDGDEQAAFFNEVARLAAKWSRPLEFQMQGVSACGHLSDAAREVMQKIGEYSKVKYVKYIEPEGING